MTATTSSSSKRKGDDPSNKKSKKAKVAVVDKEQSSSQQKRAVKHERQSHRKHADAVAASKEIWNKLRLKNNSPEETRRLMAELMDLLRGKVNEVALQHDASRIVQAAIQFGTPEERKEIVMELCQTGSLAALSKVQYAHFVLLKMIKYCSRDEDCVRAIVTALKGSIPKLAVHAVGARVIELLFSNFSPKATAPLKQEFYGPHFSLFAAELNAHPTLVSNLEIIPEKKDVTLEFLVSVLNKAMEKGLFGFVYLQELFSEYVSVAPPEDIRAMAPNVVDHSIHMLSTRAGTRVVAACTSYGTAKDRKRILKSLKGYTRSSLLHRDAYLAILRLVQITDDTVSIHKSILAEILTEPKENESPLLEIALHEAGSRLFLMLLVSSEEERQKYFDPYERQLLDPNPTVLEDGEKVPTSKKNPETRRKELMNYLRKPLMEMCSMHADVLLRSLPGSRVLREVYSAFHPQDVVDAVVSVCVGELSTAGGAAADDEHDDNGVVSLTLFEDPVGHLAVKHLLSCDVDDDKALFATAFYDKMQSRLMEVGSSNRGAFVLTALLKVDATRDKALAELSLHKKELSKLAKQGKATAGFTALLQEMSGTKVKE